MLARHSRGGIVKRSIRAFLWCRPRLERPPPSCRHIPADYLRIVRKPPPRRTQHSGYVRREIPEHATCTHIILCGERGIKIGPPLDVSEFFGKTISRLVRRARGQRAFAESVRVAFRLRRSDGQSRERDISKAAAVVK